VKHPQSPTSNQSQVKSSQDVDNTTPPCRSHVVVVVVRQTQISRIPPRGHDVSAASPGPIPDALRVAPVTPHHPRRPVAQHLSRLCHPGPGAPNSVFGGWEIVCSRARFRCDPVKSLGSLAAPGQASQPLFAESWFSTSPCLVVSFGSAAGEENNMG
jgi:hypothetical protein